jgi:aspartyl/asparaginyl-tRNA synthetase
MSFSPHWRNSRRFPAGGEPAELESRIKELGIPREELWWYLDTRRFGTAPHSGFGLGFERMMLLLPE